MDPRTTLDNAAQQRLACQVMPVGGGWTDGVFVRVDKAGVVVVAPGIGLKGGEDVRVWFSLDETSCSFEASVLRAGVPVPDRSQDGLMLGFIDGWKEQRESEIEVDRALELVIIPANGSGLDLVSGECKLVDISASELTFTVASGVALKFLEGGEVRVKLGVDGNVLMASGVVKKLAPSAGHFLYGLEFVDIQDEVGHLKAIEAFRGIC
jgi:hypothetical protein